MKRLLLWSFAMSVAVVCLGAAEFVPSNPKEMLPLTDKNSAGQKALKNFRRGMNLGNYLEAPKGQDWGQHYTEADFVHIKTEGFDHVRLPIRWNDYSGPVQTSNSPTIFTRKLISSSRALSSTGLTLL